MTLVQTLYRLVSVIIVSTIMVLHLSGQNSNVANQELKSKAHSLFEQDQYVKAFPLYSQLLSLDRDDHELQYRFGVCLLYSDRSDTYAPIKYLKKALNHIETPDIYYHLGFAYHINYNFPSAISYYKEYQAKAGKKQKKSFDVARKIEMCQNGIGMMRSVKDLFVLDKSEVARDEFFRSYDLKNYGGKMIQKPEEFLTKEDEKQSKSDFLFFNSKAPEIYYSAYDKDHKNQKDIYKRIKTEEGGWSEPIRLPETINTPYDEDFPVLMPDGITLYFSSKGHNTIGGYDIFKSVYNRATASWSPPVNVNFPFNTPVDDILFVPDTLESTAWFASVRNSVDEKIMVYKVGIVKRPGGSEDLAAIYAKNQELTEADLKAIKDRARLEVNISEKDYEGMADTESDPLAQTQEMHQENLNQLSTDLLQKQQEQAIIDSAKYYVNSLERNIESFDSLRQKAASIAAAKRLESKRIREDVKSSLKLANSANNMDGKQKAVEMANRQMLKAERLDYEAVELDAFAREIKQNIDQQRETFVDINTRYGDAEQAVINGNQDRAIAIIGGMHHIYNKVPQLQQMENLQPNASEESMIKIQYPHELNQEDQFAAFVINNVAGQTQIQSFDERYETYIPQLESKQITTIESDFSNQPSVRLGQYINTLNDTKKSVDIQIDEINSAIADIRHDFSNLSEEEKQSQISNLNQLAEEKRNLKAKSEWMSSEVDEKQKQLGELQLSSMDVDSKMEKYQNLNADLEQIFDFSKKTFKADAVIPSALAVTNFSMNASGEIVTQSQQPKILSSSELDFNTDSKNQIEGQTLQMLSETRKLQKENQFLQRKVQNRISQLELQSQEAFNDAKNLLDQSRQTAQNNQQAALNKANIKFNQAAKLHAELSAYQKVENELNQAIIDQTNMINRLQLNQSEIQNSLKNDDLDAAESLYLNMEKTYQNSKAIGDFSSEIAYDSGKIQSEEIKNVPDMNLYQISANGDIVKTIGERGADWESFEDFSADIAHPMPTNLVLAPNVDLKNRQTQFVDIFSPQTISDEERIQIIETPIPDIIKASDNSLIKNTINQTNHLETKANQLIRKRNQVNSYYHSALVQAKKLEDESLSDLSTATLSKDVIDVANQKALQSKAELYKASVAAYIIRQYDEQILQHTQLITKSIDVAKQMDQLIGDGNQDDALLLSVQFQRELSILNNREIEDSEFNFAVNEVFAELPEIFKKSDNQEFVVVDAQVQRNDQAKLSQFFYQKAYPVKTQLAGAELITISSAKENLQSFEFAQNEQARETDELQDEFVNENATAESQNNIGIAQNNAEESPLSQSETRNEQLASQNNLTAANQATKNQGLQSFNPESFETIEDFRGALSSLNSLAQRHISDMDQKSDALTLLAESKLSTSNNFSLQAENASGRPQKILQDSAKLYLYEAMSIKKLLETYGTYVDLERAKQEQITQTTFQIESKLKGNDINGAREDFKKLQRSVDDFDASPTDKISEISQNMQDGILKAQNSMDSAYNVSQVLANKSVQFLSEAAEEREKAESKRSAFKRREHLKTAEEKELEATRLQNESEKALAIGNQFYQDKEVLRAFKLLIPALHNLNLQSEANQDVVANRAVVFENIDSRKAEVLEGQLSTTTDNKTDMGAQNTPLASTNDVHIYQRENFKAEMISEELDLLKREIALLVQTQNKVLPERESYIISQKIKLLRQKADSLEYEANKAFEFANRVLESLSVEDRKEAQESGRDFESYLSELKTKIEVLLSEAASLKQRAQRSNNIQSREDLFDQAKQKEEVAMYLILEEFEVIAQKNKTRYRRNQLILEQLLMERASPEERDLMRNIFAQIDDYFSLADSKRKKANESGISFSMKKILLQDAYSLEMKALDLQQQAKTMIENNDRIAMLAYQKDEQSIQQNRVDASQTANQLATVENNDLDHTPELVNTNSQQRTEHAVEREIPIIENNMEEGIYYRVQFVALKELKNTNDFPGIAEVKAQRVSGTDYIRYFSGQFNSLDDAIIRRNSIRASGYRDAFIKSWRNGEEVNLLSLNEGGVQTTTTTTANLSTETQVNNIDFSATNISSLQGVYYTVQVGIYSRPRTSAMIFDIAPLYHKRMDNGYWIYYSGIFKSISNAESKKQEIVEKGVSDAFIVAFSNGDQINLADARQQISRGEETPSDDAIVILEDASNQLNQQWSRSQSNTIVEQDNDNGELVYKIQVGVYSNPVNLNWISSQLDTNIAVKSYQNSNGKYVYTVGEFSSANEARMLLNEVSQLVSDAFLVGFQNGQKKYIR